MKCPICKTHEEYFELDLHASGFAEEIDTCRICGTVWSVSHGVTNIVKDPQQKSFLSAFTDCIGSDEYSFEA